MVMVIDGAVINKNDSRMGAVPKSFKTHLEDIPYLLLNARCIHASGIVVFLVFFT
jgi:hypothetical protein